MSEEVPEFLADNAENISSHVWRNISSMSNISDNISDLYIPLCNFGGFQVVLDLSICRSFKEQGGMSCDKLSTA